MADHSGKTMIVTGATSGIGLETSRALARTGARVVLFGRSQERLDAATADIKHTVPDARLDTVLIDYTSLASVRAAAADFKARFDRLDVLINNHAIIPASREVTADGYETQFQVNYLGFFLLTNLLLDVLKASAPARIVNVSSSLYSSGKLNFDDLQSAKSYGRGGWEQYNNTKLMIVLFTVDLARRLEDSGVTVNVLHPGVYGTNLIRGMEPGARESFLASLPSPETSAEPSVYLATSPDVANVNGVYFDQKRQTPLNRTGSDRVAAHRLWQVTAEMLGLT